MLGLVGVEARPSQRCAIHTEGAKETNVSPALPVFSGTAALVDGEGQLQRSGLKGRFQTDRTSAQNGEAWMIATRHQALLARVTVLRIRIDPQRTQSSGQLFCPLLSMLCLLLGVLRLLLRESCLLLRESCLLLRFARSPLGLVRSEPLLFLLLLDCHEGQERLVVGSEYHQLFAGHIEANAQAGTGPSVHRRYGLQVALDPLPTGQHHLLGIVQIIFLDAIMVVELKLASHVCIAVARRQNLEDYLRRNIVLTPLHVGTAIAFGPTEDHQSVRGGANRRFALDGVPE